ncbi:GGDEF domain-containing protein [Clostridium tetani]|uniref:GGDEF domain-containing protein n=1 Tax=Clostridium tetani TaxID=1513 RepID=A0ABY0EMQ4_CLOTA|nr:GGDEF domain-containing protein [Clostridium tetani]CDI48889.1 GGDEF domain-containing protein [Clostridium tetani 12124569]KHO39790.1 diguanylate cyclase [Clostridium tetani]RXI38453.1 GGDEF domain-containing protein [Clostridium tetani]RXI54211.1 GGDEF domain-containing protein [Clostridium tetani]RXI68873.1 GGDEF domain-containing protein [Clostridium tetani]
MNKTIKKLDAYILLFLLDLFCILSFLFFNMDKNTIIDFIMLSVLFLILFISYFKRIVWSIISSAISIFGLGSYTLYNNLVYGREVIINTYMWMGAIPITAVLLAKIGEYINILEDTNINLQQEYENLVTIDKTTGLGNIKSFYMDLDKEISKSKRYEKPLSLMMIKLEFYDEIKALIGEIKMKELLKEIGKIITSFTRKEDISCKLGQDTLAILMPETDKNGAEVVKTRIKETLKEINLNKNKENNHINLDIKIGVLQYDKTVENAFEFKKIAEKELEYDV